MSFVLRWLFLIFLFAVTWGLFYVIPYAADIGSLLMGSTGWYLLPGALIVAYLGFIGPLWGKALRPFRSNPDVPLFPPYPDGPQ
jgi:hypothetical protein